MPCVPSTRTASKPSSPSCAAAARRSKGEPHGIQTRQDPSRVERRNRPFLHDQQEQEDDPGQDGNQEIRSGRAQARDLQGSEDQVIREAPSQKKNPPFGGFF